MNTTTTLSIPIEYFEKIKRHCKKNEFSISRFMTQASLKQIQE